MTKQQKSQSGNALWFILIAIALLGLLTMMMSRSSSTSNETGSYEQNQIAASEILNYAKSIENAVQSLLARGCSENEISFENNLIAGYTNPKSPTDHSCHVFEPEGAGQTYEIPNENIFDRTHSSEPWYGNWHFTSRNVISNAGDTCPQDKCADLAIILSFANKKTCLQINNLVKMQNPSGNPPAETSGIATNNDLLKFTGNYNFSAGIDMGSSLQEYTSGCVDPVNLYGTAFSNSYHIFYVLHAR